MEKIKLKNDFIYSDVYNYKSVYSCFYFRQKEKTGKLSQYVTQFEEFFDNDFIDKKKTYSNYISEMVEIFGIEAGRKIYFKILSEFIYGTGSDLNPSYISFICDFYTFTGNYIGVSIKSMHKSSLGYISGLAVREISSSILSSSMGSEESLSNISLSNIFGQKMNNIGTSLGYDKYDITKKDLSTIEEEKLKSEIIHQENIEIIKNEERGMSLFENESDEEFDDDFIENFVDKLNIE